MGDERPRLTGADVLLASLTSTVGGRCGECGCDPDNPWYDPCENPDCPCSEAEDDEQEDR